MIIRCRVLQLLLPFLVSVVLCLMLFPQSANGFVKEITTSITAAAAAGNPIPEGGARSKQTPPSPPPRSVVLLYQSTNHNNINDRPYFVPGPLPETRPDYDSIHGPMGKHMDELFLSMFRTKLADQVGVDSVKPKSDYSGLIELVKAMNARFSDRNEIHRRSQKTLSELFPSWMPPSYAVLFSKPFPAFSARMNAWATKMAGTWLMGECEINDVEIMDKEDGTTMIGRNQGLLVKRCRFLEDAQCASVCVNSCKIPTQNFFLQEMGLPLTMTPDYETFECQFAFGRLPDDDSEMAAKNTPCLSRCPSAGGLREWHNNNNSNNNVVVAGKRSNKQEERQQCQLMED